MIFTVATPVATSEKFRLMISALAGAVTRSQRHDASIVPERLSELLIESARADKG